MKISLKLFFLISLSVVSGGFIFAQNAEKTDAVVVWTGSAEVDGCEWMIDIDDVLYKPSGLLEEYKIDKLDVKLVYENDSEFEYYCGDSPVPQTAIKILEIEKTITAIDRKEANASRVRSFGGQLHVESNEEGILTVYAIDGRLIKQQIISAGTTSIALAGNLYIIRFPDGSVQKSTVK